MGSSRYDSDARSVRATASAFYTANVNDIFQQNKARVIHDLMSPKGVLLRESCDSDVHPFTVPIQLYLDVTGSMGHIPHEMIKDGLPTLMGKLIQNGVKDAALMFGAIGDHECDRVPLQIGQFESGDAELDMWLTRTYLEGGGGGNAGESYALAWYFAANHIRTDAWDKRKAKGFVFTIGDEPPLRTFPMSAIKEIMGNTAVGQATYDIKDLLTKAQEKNHVYHIHIAHGVDPSAEAWKDLLGQHFVVIKDHHDVAKTISDIILAHPATVANTPTGVTDAPPPDTQVFL